jgi:ketosteroid isomerase-like protein
MTGEQARAFANEWAAAWNELAVERVLAHFDENVSFTSPTALAVVGEPTVRGKQALREYWNRRSRASVHFGLRLIGCGGMPVRGSWRLSMTRRSMGERGAFPKT